MQEFAIAGQLHADESSRGVFGSESTGSEVAANRERTKFPSEPRPAPFEGNESSGMVSRRKAVTPANGSVATTEYVSCIGAGPSAFQLPSSSFVNVAPPWRKSTRLATVPNCGPSSQRRFPFGTGGVNSGIGSRQFGPQRGQLLFDRFQLCLLGRRDDRHQGGFIARITVGRLGEDREEPVVVLLRNGSYLWLWHLAHPIVRPIHA